MLPKTPRPALRLISCSACGHKNRYGREWCSDCGRVLPSYNRPGFLVGLLLFAALATLVLVML